MKELKFDKIFIENKNVREMSDIEEKIAGEIALSEDFGKTIYCARDFLDGDSLIHAGDAFMLDHNRYLSMKNETSSKLYYSVEKLQMDIQTPHGSSKTVPGAI